MRRLSAVMVGAAALGWAIAATAQPGSVTSDPHGEIRRLIEGSDTYYPVEKAVMHDTYWVPVSEGCWTLFRMRREDGTGGASIFHAAIDWSQKAGPRQEGAKLRFPSAAKYGGFEVYFDDAAQATRALAAIAQVRAGCAGKPTPAPAWPGGDTRISRPGQLIDRGRGSCRLADHGELRIHEQSTAPVGRRETRRGSRAAHAAITRASSDQPIAFLDMNISADGTPGQPQFRLPIDASSPSVLAGIKPGVLIDGRMQELAFVPVWDLVQTRIEPRDKSEGAAIAAALLKAGNFTLLITEPDHTHRWRFQLDRDLPTVATATGFSCR